MSEDHRCFTNNRDAALALLNGGYRLSRKSGGFLGQLIVDHTPLTARQRKWLDDMLEDASLPPISEDEVK